MAESLADRAVVLTFELLRPKERDEVVRLLREAKAEGLDDAERDRRERAVIGYAWGQIASRAPAAQRAEWDELLRQSKGE